MVWTAFHAALNRGALLSQTALGMLSTTVALRWRVVHFLFFLASIVVAATAVAELVDCDVAVIAAADVEDCV